jgi:hypothetical protein
MVKKRISPLRASRFGRDDNGFARWDLFPLFGGDGLGGGEGLEEDFVLFLGEGAVDVVGGALVPAGGEVDLVHVDGAGVDDGGDGVVEGEVAGASDALELVRERR